MGRVWRVQQDEHHLVGQQSLDGYHDWVTTHDRLIVTACGERATVFSTAERDGKLSTSDLMSKYVPEWGTQEKTKNISMEHVMRHCSGRYYGIVT